MIDLRKLWENGGLIADQNNDQICDQVNVQIKLNEGVCPKGLIDFCARLGFETTSLSFDFLQENGRYEHLLTFTKEEVTKVEWNTSGLNISYENEEQLSELLRFLAGKWHYHFIAEDKAVKKIVLRNKIIYIYDMNDNELSSCKAPFSIKNVDSSNRSYQIKSLTEIWNDIGFLRDYKPSPENKQSITFNVSNDIHQEVWKEIYYGAARIGMEATSIDFPLTGEHSLNALTFSFQLNESAGSIELLENNVIFSGKGDALTRAISYFFREKHWSFGGHFACWEKKFNILTHREEELLHYYWEDAGEVSEIYERIQDSNESLHNKSSIVIYVSESKKNRDEMKSILVEKYPNAEIIIRSSFKPGYFWITEEVLPKIKDLKIGSISIKCKNSKTDDGLELPIRWIQELYPIDEVLAKELLIDSDNIQFELCDSLKSTYKIIVKDVDGKILLDESIIIPVSKVPYVEEGKYSYPTTSYLSIQQDDFFVEHYIQTDRERFYTYYLEEILPKLWDKVKDYTDYESGFTKPLFDRIEIEVEMSEEEVKLPVDEERISSLEALHEDLYFNTLDYFVEKGKQTIGKGYESPGGVYPFLIVKEKGKPEAKITAYKWMEQNREKVLTKKLIFGDHSKTPDEVMYHFEDGEELQLVQVPEKFQIDSIPDYVHQPKKAHIYPWLTDYSYRGKPIFVYEFFNQIVDEYYSASKLSTFKPTVLIETGHHANEVSSMPAIVELMDEIVTEHPEIMNHINLVIIPCANPDGVELHHLMTKDNPEWKHHAARYNAVGLEFTDVRYKESVFGEANVVPKIMNRWAPDIVIDDHGIPSHEWTQPFAGYHIPPRFNMSFWIPNSFIYGIAQKLDEEKYPKHAEVLHEIISSIYEKIKSTDIHEANKYWMKRYTKYGRRFIPELFPIEAENDFIFYKWHTEADAQSRSEIGRFPEWVSADIISEVADETVYGDVLEQCKKAHRLFDLGAIDWIKKDHQKIKKIFDEGNITIKRKRPLNIVKDE